jgi:hypothetical protein
MRALIGSQDVRYPVFTRIARLVICETPKLPVLSSVPFPSLQAALSCESFHFLSSGVREARIQQLFSLEMSFGHMICIDISQTAQFSIPETSFFECTRV